MLRRTCLRWNWKAEKHTERIRTVLRGRAAHERKLGNREIIMRLKCETQYRTMGQKQYWSAVKRTNAGAAANELGTDYPRLINDCARQNVLLLPSMCSQLAKYEPLAFRALVEMCASAIPPPPPPAVNRVPPEAYSPQDSAATTAELKSDVKRLRRLSQHSPPLAAVTTEEWVNAWTEFTTIPPEQRLKTSDVEAASPKGTS